LAILNVQKASLTGLTPVFVLADKDGNSFTNDGKVILYIKNGGDSPVTVTIDSQHLCNYGFDHNVVVVIPATEERIIGPFRQDRFNDATGKVVVAYSGVTSVTVAAIG